MANKIKTDGYRKLGDSVGELGGGLGAVGKKIWSTIAGGGRGGASAGKGVVGMGANVANSGAKITGNVIGGVGNFAKDHPGFTAVAALVLAYRPLKKFINTLRGKKDNDAIGSQNDILSLQQQNSELRAAIAQNRQAGSMTSAMLGSGNPVDGRALSRAQLSRGVGAGTGIPPYNQ